MRTIGVLTTSRADYGCYRPILRRISDDPDLNLRLFVTGMHLVADFGMTVCEIEADGFEISDRIDMLIASDTPEAIAKSMGLGTIGFAQAVAASRPDMLLALGDRFEMHAAVVASLPFKIPIAHIHGGESTQGAMDESIRHSITKMSHLHFASTEFYAKRIIQMGEEPWRVVVSGAPSLDNILGGRVLTRAELLEEHGLALGQQTLLVTFHPVTLEYERTESYTEELLAALNDLDLPIVFTNPNADTYGRKIIAKIRRYVESDRRCHVVSSLGTEAYFSLLKYVVAMVGNSSSGIIEAASFHLPVVNIGNRQLGRIHEKNVIDVLCERSDIRSGIEQAISSDFHSSLDDLVNPYGAGQASKVIVEALKSVKLGDTLLMKRFHTP